MFKKLAALATTGIMLVSFQLPVFAASSSYEIDDEFLTPEIIEQQREETARAIEEGNRIFEQMKRGVIPRERRTLAINRLSQHDPLWENENFPCENDLTYGQAGCALTCYAMMSRYKNNNFETPVTFATRYYKKYGHPCNQVVSNAASLINMKVGAANKEPSRADVESTVYSAITNGNPVMIRVQSSKFNSHYVVAYGFTYDPAIESTIIYIRDPENRNYTTMSQYFVAGFWVREYAELKR